MRDSSPQTVLITGATSGIGRELALIFAREGYNLHIVARTEQTLNTLTQELEQSHHIRCRYTICDLSQPTAAEMLVQEIKKQGEHIDILVNNAGFGNWGRFDETNLSTEIEEIQLNILSLVKLTKFFVPEMKQRRCGKILNVASTAGFVPGPYMAIYYATKAFVISFSEALREEMRGSGITVSVVCPGETPTNFQKRAGIGRINLTRKVFMTDSAYVAREAYEGLMGNRAVIIPGMKNKLLMFSRRLLPRITVRAIVRWMNIKR